MKLNRGTDELATKFELKQLGGVARVTGVQLASNLCLPGDLFVAIAGKNSHGIDHLSDALERGAVAVLTDAAHVPNTNVPILVHHDPKSVAGFLAAEIYQTPYLGMKLFGVTGTNGKTSTVTFLQELLSLCGIDCGLSASTNRIVGKEVYRSSLTTPEVTELHRMLSQMHHAGQNCAAIEVSAQAMIRHRVDGLKFDVVGFTNLSREHFDDFADMQEYLSVKAKLFEPKFASLGVVLVEDEYAKQLADQAQIPIVTIGEDADYGYLYEDGQLEIFGKQNGQFAFALGGLMAKNLVLALVMLLEAGVPMETLQTAVSKASFKVPGRLERISSKSPAVFIDYAHTPAGIEAVVEDMRGKYPWLTVILGVAGNRDQGKRPDMSIAAKSADLLIITDQTPRFEDPADIRKTLLTSAATVMPLNSLAEVPDPTDAIKHAIAVTPENGAVLWCGPGDLTYREVAGVKIPYDARKIVAELMSDD